MTEECEKLASKTEKWEAIYQFIEWLHENHMCIGVWRTKEEVTDEKGYVQEWLLEHPYPYGQSIENLLYKYFDIDVNKLEAERRALLEGIRQKQNIQK